MQQHIDNLDNSESISGQRYADLAMEYHYSGDPEKALECANLAIELEPDNDAFLHTLGILYHSQNQREKAISCFSKAISINNQNLIYYFHLGIVYKELGEMIFPYLRVVRH